MRAVGGGEGFVRRRHGGSGSVGVSGGVSGVDRLRHRGDRLVLRLELLIGVRAAAFGGEFFDVFSERAVHASSERNLRVVVELSLDATN